MNVLKSSWICIRLWLLCLLVCVHCEKYILKLTATEFPSVKSQPGVNLVYFFKKSGGRNLGQRQKIFLEQYEKSAKLIAVYDVKFGQVDCPTPGVEEYCGRPDIESKVVVFRNGNELLSLDLDNMFDIDSIVSNVLQLVLIREVPIVQKEKEFTDVLTAETGHKDVILSYQHAIGTHALMALHASISNNIEGFYHSISIPVTPNDLPTAHRVFMEVAFAYKSKYKFALTTEKKVVQNLVDYKKDDEAGIWVLKCSLAKDSDENAFPTHKYREKMDLMEVARYVKNLDKQLIYEVPVTTAGESNPFIELDLHTTFLFCDEKSRKDTLQQAQEILDDFYGLIGVLIVNIDKVDGSRFGFDPVRMSVPAVAFQYRRQEVYNFMPANKHPHVFLNNYLSRVARLDRRAGIGSQQFSEVLGEEEEEGGMEGMGLDDGAEYGEEVSAADLARQTDIEMVETQDDHVAATVYKLRNQKIDRSQLTALNDTSFYTEVKDTEFMIVLFYLTFDARGMAFLRHYSAASLELAGMGLHPLATVDCFDWTDVCGKVNVTSYPTIRIYRKGMETKTYDGMLSQAAMVKTALLYLAQSPVYLETEEDYNAFLAGDFPKGLGNYTNVAVLGIYETHELPVYIEAVFLLQGKFLFGHVQGDLARKLASQYNTHVPSVAVFRRHDPLRPYTVYPKTPLDADDLVQFIQTEALSSFPELSVANLPAYLAKKRPLVILFASTLESESRKVLAEMAADAQMDVDVQTDVIYCWMNVTSPTGLARQIMLEYNPASSVPALSLVDKAQGAVYNYNGIEMARGKISQWIQDVLARNIKPSKMLISREWKPRHPGYDFLKFIEEEKQQKLAPDMPYMDESVALPDEKVRSHLQEVHHTEERSRFRTKTTDTHHRHVETEPSHHKHVEL